MILTTHSMEEADILATTISIMVNGYMRCCANPVSLRAKYGTGFKLELKAGDVSQVSAARRIVEQQMPHAKFEEHSGRSLCYTIARAPTSTSISTATPKPTSTLISTPTSAMSTPLQQMGGFESKDEVVVAIAVPEVAENGDVDVGVTVDVDVDVDVNLGDVFSTMLDAAAASGSKEMAVSQDSLEQIFLLFAKLSVESATMTDAPSILRFKPGPCFVNYLRNAIWCVVSFVPVAVALIWAAFIGPVLAVVSWLLSKLIAVPYWLISPSAASYRLYAPTPFPFQRAMCQLLTICMTPIGRDLHHGALPKHEVRHHHLANAIWLLLVGLPLGVVHMAWGAVQCCTYVLIPVARIEFALASNCVQFFFVPMPVPSAAAPSRGREVDLDIDNGPAKHGTYR